MGLHADLFRRGQRSGDLRTGDPEVLARLLSGMVTAFQAIDVDTGRAAGDGAADGASLGTLHGVVEDAFGAVTPE